MFLDFLLVSKRVLISLLTLNEIKGILSLLQGDGRSQNESMAFSRENIIIQAILLIIDMVALGNDN